MHVFRLIILYILILVPYAHFISLENLPDCKIAFIITNQKLKKFPTINMTNYCNIITII